MSKNLKGCPLCGSTDVIFEREGNYKQSCIVSCQECGLTLESNEEGDRCGTQWNRRVDSEMETVKEWEIRNKTTYPDTAPVWYMHHIGVWFMGEYSDARDYCDNILVANSSGRPDSE